jgi:hypothetical protein
MTAKEIQKMIASLPQSEVERAINKVQLNMSAEELPYEKLAIVEHAVTYGEADLAEDEKSSVSPYHLDQYIHFLAELYIISRKPKVLELGKRLLYTSGLVDIVNLTARNK